MIHQDTDVLAEIRTNYNNFTSAEKAVADFFLVNTKKMDFSSKIIASKLFVSEASLSRFAQKCGFKGYREFIFVYEKTFESGKLFASFDKITQGVLSAYQNLLDKSLKIVNEKQMRRIADMLKQSKCVYLYGMGSSGIAATELKIRFMRLGMLVEAITDSHMIKMNSALLDSTMTVIAISLSGKTPEIINGMKSAKECGANVIFMTSDTEGKYDDITDEILHVASADDLSEGINISPQFPILVMMDIFFSYYFNSNERDSTEKFKKTLEALKK
jgi:DNA-binding MurR/RpiR family transcriptional regulator